MTMMRERRRCNSLLVIESWFVFRTALNVQIFIKMHRSDYAERQLRIMQQIDEDHTLTQLANAWLDLSVVILNINYYYLNPHEKCFPADDFGMRCITIIQMRIVF